VVLVNAEAIVGRYYRMITASPARTSTSIALVLLLVLIYSILLTLPKLDPAELVGAFELYSAEVLLFIVALSPLVRTRVFNARRLLNLALVTLLVTLPAELILGRLGGLAGLGLSTGSGFLVYVLVAFLSLPVVVVASVASTALAATLGRAVVGLNLPYGVVVTALLISAISSAIGLTSIFIIERSGWRKGVSPVRAIRAFTRAWILGDREALEDLFRSYGVSDRVSVKAVVFFREGGNPVALVYPGFHFGPFRSVGSARFLYLLEERLSPAVDVLVFHTPGSHERNIATFTQSFEIARAVATTISSYSPLLARMGLCRPQVVREGGWELYVIRGPTLLIGYLANTERGNDDLPYSLWKLGERVQIESKPLNLVAVADSHSAKGEKVSELEIPHSLIQKLRDPGSCSEEEFYLGYAEVSGVMCRELCSDRVKVVTLRYSDGTRYAIVYVYGNNMSAETREKIVALLRERGIEEPLVVTPDDHSCAASFKEKPYHVVSDCQHLYQAILKALEDAIESEAPARYVTLEHIFSDVELAGDNVWRLTQLVGSLGRLTAKLLVVTLITTGVVIPTALLLAL
jgi:putative membrane protein